jgi:dienelactone hydrolase
MKRLLYTVLLFLSFKGTAQDSFYNSIEMGKYNVGFFDTLIFSDSLTYNQYGYVGKAPIFVQVWHPIKPVANPNYLSYSDFRNQKLPANLRAVYDALNQQANAVFIETNVATALSTYESIDYGSSSYEDVFNKLKMIQTKSIHANLTKKTKYPIIVYHHGTQGISDENYVMAEYFASRGYIFVSANYHLPYPELIYGLTESVTNNQSAVKTVIEFANTLSSNKYTFYAGHSWGAQTGWCFLNEPGWADAFVSLETTIEYKEDSLQIKDMWPYVYETIKTKKSSYAIPILMFANTQVDEPFWFFENTCSSNLYFASIKDYLEHNSYTSVYLMRYFLSASFNLPDKEILGNQIKLYALHLHLMHDFFQSVITNKPLDAERYRQDFFFN